MSLGLFIYPALRRGRALMWPLLALSLTLSGCEEPEAVDTGGDPTYVEIFKGGFVYDVHSTDAHYGFTVKVKKPMPIGTELVATFENPRGKPIVQRQTYLPEQDRYRFRTPPLQGIVEGRTYVAELRLSRGRKVAPLATYRLTYRSGVDQRELRERKRQGG